MEENVYIENGYEDRKAYLYALYQEYGNDVYYLADILGPDEDFDGLISALQDLEEDF